MKSCSIYQVDAFTTRPFHGNPAGVCILDEPIAESLMQSIAAEMNLSETAFVHPICQGTYEQPSEFLLKWFTPEVEVPLCGHATLATAHVLFNELKIPLDKIIYHTKSGQLTAQKSEHGIVLNFPLGQLLDIEPPRELLTAVGITDFVTVKDSPNMAKILIEVASAPQVYEIAPNFEAMRRIGRPKVGVIVTARADEKYDFISRFFAPMVGVNEDPVTGAAHTVLAAYWSAQLTKTELYAFQASKRGGEMRLHIPGNNRVELIGQAVTVLKGQLCI